MTAETAKSPNRTPSCGDYYLRRSFVAGGMLSTITAVKQTEGLLGFYKGNSARFPYDSNQFLAFDGYKKLIQHKTGKLDHVDKLVSGSMAGITAVTCPNPLDVVRARLAFQIKEEQHKGVIHAFRRIYTNEGGFRGYYKGLGLTLISMAPYAGILSTISAGKQNEGQLGFYSRNIAILLKILPYSAIQLMAFEEYKKLIKHKTGKLDHMDKFVSGSVAGITAMICTYPLDVVRARLTFQVKGEDEYKGVIHAFRSIYTNEGGFRGYYKGLVPTIIGMAPYAGISFYTFESLKTSGLENAPKLLGQASADNPDVLLLKTPIKLLFGGLSGAISQTIVYPWDVARRRMLLADILQQNENCQTMFQTLRFIYREHGVRHGLYRGLSISYIRCIPTNAVAFTILEYMRQLLHLNKSN
ncbi:solute carrier family 25 member 16-like isoform X2 [Rhinoderma darwinii]|uniref:solute carrier family 25 member 16-like isoform X2 n=1 Tax=Rhinoderma darwinii TaxID=43563 RepID=UPI003F664118